MGKKKKKSQVVSPNRVVINLYPPTEAHKKRKDKKEKKKEYLTYCRVSFSEGGRYYSYIADYTRYSVGDFVIVPAGYTNRLCVVRIEEIERVSVKKAPYPPGRTKHILRKYYGMADDYFDIVSIGYFPELRDDLMEKAALSVKADSDDEYDADYDDCTGCCDCDECCDCDGYCDCEDCCDCEDYRDGDECCDDEDCSCDGDDGAAGAHDCDDDEGQGHVTE